MPGPTLGAARYILGWIRGRHLAESDESPPTSPGPPEFEVPGVRTEEVVIGGGSSTHCARRYSRRSQKSPAPGWVVLHGVTRPGPDHPAIVRFAAALARSGAVVLVPDIPPWRRLDLDPSPARTALIRATEHMASDPWVRPGGVVLVGLSFGFPQVLRVGGQLAEAGLVRGLAGFGAYCRLADTLRFALTGQFRWRGRTNYLRPDPYGRWVVAANYLHRVPGYEEAECVSDALRRLAAVAGERRIMAWDPSYDVVKNDLEGSIPEAHRPLFRVFAPPADREPRPGLAREMASLLAEAGRKVHPDLEPPSRIGCTTPLPIRLLHGRRDHLIPFTETLALERLLRKGACTDVSATVTGLFAHSRESGATTSRLRESVRFFMRLREVIALQDA